MKKILILSGKGGTGKTTTASAFIEFSKASAFADCDVDAPNLHLVTEMHSQSEKSLYYGSQKAEIMENKCINCRKCMENCNFGAISQGENHCEINIFSCEGCGVCAYVCPQNAIVMQDDISGNLELFKENRIFSTAKLKMGRGNSGKLVTAVKSALYHAVTEEKLAIIDGSPGIGCPVIASINGVDLVLIVAEPSISGISDMERIVKTAKGFNTKIALCINKFDISLEQSQSIEDFCRENSVEFVGKIPYDKEASKAINMGKSLANTDCKARNALKNVFDNTIKLI